MSLPIKIELPNDFLKEEICCGYKVTEHTKKIWAVQLDLLQRLIEVCDKHNIKFQVGFGTLLGAVRHKGFIPWDDDLDVWMIREEYEKLCKLPQSEFGYPYFFQTAISDQKFVCTDSRFRNSKTTALLKGYEDVEYNNGIYIDVYVLDGYTDNRFKYLIQYWMLYVVQKTIAFFKKRIWKSGKRSFVYEQMTRIREKIRCLYGRNSSLFSQITCFGGYGNPIKGRCYHLSRNDLLNPIYMDYEFMKVPCSCNYNNILTMIYGNYMEFPPLEKRGIWHEGDILDPEIPFKEYIESLATKGNF